MKYLILLLYIVSIININCYQISFPTFKRNLAVIKDIDVNKLNDNDIIDLKLLFKSVPMLLFKKQKIEPKILYEFCKMFDSKANDKIVNPFSYSQIENVPHVSLRGKAHIKNITHEYSDPLKNTIIWHQDIVGHGTNLPPVVSSIYMIKSPSVGGNTLFASLEDAYDSMEYFIKREIKNYNVIYSNSQKDMMNSYFDYTGFNSVLNEKTKNIKTSIITREPLVVYSTPEKNRKALMLSPFKFNKFDKLSCDDSFDLYREIMNKYVFTEQNVVNIKWENDDLLIFNNRKLVHTSTPSIEYKNEERLYYSCFIGTSEPIIRSQ